MAGWVCGAGDTRVLTFSVCSFYCLLFVCVCVFLINKLLNGTMCVVFNTTPEPPQQSTHTLQHWKNTFIHRTDTIRAVDSTVCTTHFRRDRPLLAEWTLYSECALGKLWCGALRGGGGASVKQAQFTCAG